MTCIVHLKTKNKTDGRHGDDVIALDDEGIINFKAFLVAADDKDIKASILIKQGSGEPEYFARINVTKLKITPPQMEMRPA